MKLYEDIKLDFADVCIVPTLTKLTSRKEVCVETNYKTLWSQRTLTGIPIIAANMSSVGTFNMAIALSELGLFTALHKHYDLSDLAEFFKSQPLSVKDHTFYTLGVHDRDKFLSFSNMVGSPPSLICLDLANGYMESFHKFINYIRLQAPNSIIIAGNVVTPDGVTAIIDSGADIVKLGIGSGSQCETRIVAGVGVPQFSTLMDCYDTVTSLNALSISDGGCNNIADFGKAFCAGANFVMSGSMFAGHAENSVQDSSGLVDYYGMSSKHAMEKHYGKMESHRSSEGKISKIQFKGNVADTVRNILGGIRSTGTYINASDIHKFYDNSSFVKVNRTHNTNWS